MAYVKTCRICGRKFLARNTVNQFCHNCECLRDRRQDTRWSKVKERAEYERMPNRRIKQYLKSCEHCGKQFVSMRGNARYCCAECREEARKERENYEYPSCTDCLFLNNCRYGHELDQCDLWN